MASLNQNKIISIVFVYYNGKLQFLNVLTLLLHFFGIDFNVVIVNNGEKSISSKFNIIKGSNECQDFSGYIEGIKYLDTAGILGEKCLIINDTVDKRRFAYGSRLISLIYYLRGLECNNNTFFGEVSGCGFGEQLYGINIKKTFSSYMFSCNSNLLINFFEKYYDIVLDDLEVESKIYSKNDLISISYLNSLNYYVGFSNLYGKFGRWYNYNNTNIDLSIRKKKSYCLIFERILPTFFELNKVKIIDMFQYNILFIMRKVESIIIH